MSPARRTEPGRTRPGATGLARILPLLTLLVAAAAAHLGAQETFTVEGRVVERDGGAPVRGVSVTLGDRPETVTDADGRFRFPGVPQGRHTLTVTGMGYIPADTALLVTDDVAVVIALDLSPVPVEPVGAVARWVTVRGVVRDRATGYGVVDAIVDASPDIETETNLVGRFRVGRVPEGVPLTVRAESFGYLPVTVTFEPRSDTTLVMELEEDPVAQRMIGIELERIDDRSEGHTFEALPSLDRDELVHNRSVKLPDLLQRELGRGLWRRVVCVVVDENPMRLWRFPYLLPDEVQRVEIIEYGGLGRRLGIRVYTRDFIQDMVRGEAELVPGKIAMRTLPARVADRSACR